MNPSVEIIEQRLFAGAVADEIAAAISERISENGSASLVLAGGSTPAAVYRALACPPRVEEIDWGKVTILFGDERWVSHEDAQSNYRMAKETLLSLLPTKGPLPRILPIDTSLETPELGAAGYAKAIRAALKVEPKGVPVFDVVLLGVGEDGHTASLFPGAKAVHEKSALAVPAALGDSQRVSLSPVALFSANRVFFIISGSAKAEIAKQIIEGNDSVDKFPARLFTEAKGKVTFFVDSAAGNLLSP